MSELDKLPCLTRIITSRPDKGLLSYIAGNPFITELQLEQPGCDSLDLRGSRRGVPRSGSDAGALLLMDGQPAG